MNPAECVFISYASEDGDAARLLVQQLEQSGGDGWIAPRDVHPGQRYAEAIVEAIESCAVFLLIFSAHASASPHVANEIEKAASEDKPILLVRTDATDPASNRDVCLFLSSHHWYDAQFGTFEDHVARIVEAAVRLTRQSLPKPVDVASKSVSPNVSRLGPTGSPPPDLRSIIGIDVGSTKIAGCVLDISGAVGSDSVKRRDAAYIELVQRPASGRTVIGQVRALIGRILEEQFTEASPAGIGLAVPGQVDPRAGTLNFGPGLELRNVPFRTSLGATFPGIPVRVDNDARCATRCELHIGAGQDYESFVCMFIGSGVGSGIVLDRRVVFGANYCAGEVGHTKINATGSPCACGQVGCLETFVNGNAVSSLARAKAIEWENRDLETTLIALPQPIDPREVARALDEGDAAAQELADQIGENLGVGIANILNLLNPGAIVLGGGIMSGFFLHMIDSVTAVVQRNALASVANVPIVHSQYGDDGAAIGAGLLFHPSERWEF